jgi:hypothetical protein
MDWRLELDKMYTIFDKNDYKELKRKLLESQLIGGTGGEIFLIIATKLIEMKKLDPEVYNLIRDEADAIINYGIKIKYLKKEIIE